MTKSLTLSLLSLAMVASTLLACDTLRAARGCGFVPLDSSVVAPVRPSSAAPIGADERERRAREIMAARFGLPIESAVVHEQMTQAYGNGITAYVFKLYGPDGRYLGPILVDASGAPLSEAGLDLARTIADVRDRGKVGTQLSEAVARALPASDVPVMFQLVAPPWDGPPTPWPLDLPADAWNTFVEGHADGFYRPRVSPFVEHLRSIGARDINPNLAPGAFVKDLGICSSTVRSGVQRGTSKRRVAGRLQPARVPQLRKGVSSFVISRSAVESPT